MDKNIEFRRAEQEGRGRQAVSPTAIPKRGWKDVLWRTWTEISRDRVTLVAAGVTYYILLSLFPALAAFVSLYGLFSDPAAVEQQLDLLAGIMPEGGVTIIQDQLSRLSAQGGSTLGWALVISLGIALWTASLGVKALFEAMNVAYGETEKRGFLHLNALALVFTVGGLVAVLLMLAVVLVIPLVLSFVGLSEDLQWLVRGLSYLLLAGLLFVGMAALNRYGPSRQHARWRWVAPGSVLSVLAILVVSFLFSWYASNFANYEKTYGSLGALIGLLTWLWISSTLVIVGAELNAETEHQTAHDSTVGRTDPMGHRDAMVADTVGKAVEEGGDPVEGMSADWRAGYEAARSRMKPKPEKVTLGTLLFAVPAALALHAMKRQRAGGGAASER